MQARKIGFSLSWKDAGVTVGILIAALCICSLLWSTNGGSNYASMIFILAVFLIARLTSGYVWGIAASLIGVLAVNFFYTLPYLRFNFTLAGYPVTMLCMLAVSVTTSALTSQAKQSQQIRLEAELEKTRSNLLRAVSHDLRTPLTAIAGATSTVLENGQALSPEETKALLSGVQDNAKWLIRMVENLLAVTRMEGGGAGIVKRPEPAEELLSDAASKINALYPDIRISISAPQELLMVPMDPLLIEQVLMNLMENAVLHGQNTGRVALSVLREGNNAVFIVQDDGGGFPKEALEAMRRGGYFSSGSGGDAKRNMGIGLSVCATILRAHGGSMEARNRMGGAEVRFTLPLKEEA